MPVADSTLALLTTTAVKKEFQAGISAASVSCLPLFASVPSVGRSNTYAWLEHIPKMAEWVGERTFNSMKARRFEIVNKTYQTGYSISRDELDDSGGMFTDQIAVQQLGDTAAKLVDDLGVSLLQGGTSATCLDGQYFFDTDHPVDMDDSGAGTQQNYWSSGKALTSGNLDLIYQAMVTFKRNDGQLMGVRPTHLIVPSQLKQTAIQIVNAEFNSNGATNTYRGLVQVIEVPELSTESTAWYLADLSKPIKGLVWQPRRGIEINLQNNPNSPSVFYRNRLDFGIDTRVGAGYGPWWLMAKAVA